MKILRLPLVLALVAVVLHVASGQRPSEVARGAAVKLRMAEGDVGSDVGLLTRIIRAHDPDLLDEPSNRFTPEVTKAVKALQRHYGVGADGVVGPVTARKLFPAVNIGAPIMQRKIVAALQWYLNAKFGAALPPGEVSEGVFGLHTDSAVREMQHRLKLDVDGKVGVQTWMAMIHAQVRSVHHARQATDVRHGVPQAMGSIAVDDENFDRCAARPLFLPNLVYDDCVMLLQKLLLLPFPTGLSSPMTMQRLELARVEFGVASAKGVVDADMWMALKIYILHPDRAGIKITLFPDLSALSTYFAMDVNAFEDSASAGAMLGADAAASDVGKKAQKLLDLGRELTAFTDSMDDKKRALYWGTFDSTTPTLHNLQDLLKCAAHDHDLLAAEGWEAVERDTQRLLKEIERLGAKRDRLATALVKQFADDIDLQIFLLDSEGKQGEGFRGEYLLRWVTTTFDAVRGTKAGKDFARALVNMLAQKDNRDGFLNRLWSTEYDDIYADARLAMIQLLAVDILNDQSVPEAKSTISKLISSAIKVDTNTLDRLEEDSIAWAAEYQKLKQDMFDKKMRERIEAARVQRSEKALRRSLGVQTIFLVVQIQATVANIIEYGATEDLKDILVDGTGALATITDIQVALAQQVQRNPQMASRLRLVQATNRGFVKSVGKFALPVDIAMSVAEVMYLRPSETHWTKGAGLGVSAALKAAAGVAVMTGPGGAVVSVALLVVAAGIDVAVAFSPTQCEMLRDDLGYVAGSDNEAEEQVWEMYKRNGCPAFTSLLNNSTATSNTFTRKHGYTRLRNLVGAMVSGFWTWTHEGEEDAVLRVLTCLQKEGHCEDMKKLVYDVGLSDMLWRIGGEQDAQLRALLGECGGVVDTSSRDSYLWMLGECDKIVGAKTQDVGQHMRNVLAGWEVDNFEELALLHVLRCLRDSDKKNKEKGCARMRGAIAVAGGVDLIEGALQGREDDELRAEFEACKMYEGYTEERTRALLAQWDCATIRKKQDAELGALIANMLPYWTDNVDEQHINRLLQCFESDCVRMRAIVDAAGGARELGEHIDFAEYKEFEERLVQCKILAVYDDDKALAKVRKMECSDVMALSVLSRADLLESLMTGWFTHLEEEMSVIKILDCIPNDKCQELRDVVIKVGRNKLLDEMQGPQDAQLRAHFMRCGLINVEKVSDVVAREFARQSCAELAALSDTTLSGALKPMLSGPRFWDMWGTSPADERGVLNVLRCLAQKDCKRFRSVVEAAGGHEDMLTRIDFANHDELLGLLLQCDVVHVDKLDDDATRAFVHNLRDDCARMASYPQEVHVELVKHLLDGVTLDDDEDALVALFECMRDAPRCAVARSVVAAVGREAIEASVHGAQYDELLAAWFACDVVQASQLDDDSARNFLTAVECDTLVQLAESNARTHVVPLCASLLSGVTGNEDERALVKLFSCLSPHEKLVLALERTRECSYEAVSSSTHGAEWDVLKEHLIVPDDCYTIDGATMVENEGGECKYDGWFSCSSDDECDSTSCTGDKCVCGFGGVNACHCMTGVQKRADGQPFCQPERKTRDEL